LTFPVIDLTPALVAAKAKHDIYRPTDTHWNDHGALAGVQGLIASLRQDFPSLRPPEETEVAAKVTYRRDGDLARLMGLQDVLGETFEELRPKASRAVITLVPGSRARDSIAKVADTDLPRALFFHDSFGPPAKPFLSECFEEIRFRWSNYGLETGDFEAFEPDLVIQMMGERRIRLSQRLLPPVQQESNERYFKAATSVLASWTAPGELAALAPSSPAAKASDGGLVVTAGGAETALILPEVERADTMLPIICVELNADVRTDLALTWSTRHPERWPPFQAREVVAKVIPGGARVYLPLLDPEAVGPLRLEFRRLSGDCVVKSIEIRGIPRDAPPAAVAPSGSR
jgi:hypothetical protein